MEIKNFNIEFVKRTKKILNEYSGGFDFSTLINCTLGLLILPYENVKFSTNPIWDQDVSEIATIRVLDITRFEPIEKIKSGNTTYYPKTAKVFLQKIRNGLAHQNIQTINDNGSFTGVIIKNFYFEKQDLEVTFTQKQLHDFALFIADQYLSATTKSIRN